MSLYLWPKPNPERRALYQQAVRRDLTEDARERTLCATKLVQDGRLAVAVLTYELDRWRALRCRS